MKTRLEVTRWETGDAFDVRPHPVGTDLQRFSPAGAATFEELKENVTMELGRRFASVRADFLRLAVNEAAALAADTAFPALFLPALAEEKVRAAAHWAARQRLIHDQTLALAA